MVDKIDKLFDPLVVRVLSCVLLAVLLAGINGCASFSGSRPLQAIEFTARVGYGMPQGFSVQQGGLRMAELSWYAPEQSVFRYRIERSSTEEGPFAWVADIPGNRVVFIDGQPPLPRLQDSTTYFYRICAIFDKKGVMGMLTKAAATTTAPPPEPPRELQVKATGSREVTLSWQAASSPNIASYRIERAQASLPEEFGEIGSVNGLGFVDGGSPSSSLNDSSRYFYRVVAINAVGSESVPSVLAEVTTFPPPAIPQGLKGASLEVRCAPLSWLPNPEEDVVRYDIYQGRAADGKFVAVGNVHGHDNTHFIDGGGNPGDLEDDGTYFYCIRAVNRVTAESADSAIVSVTTRPVPPITDNLQALSARPREVPLTWDASPDTAVTGYEIWRATAADEDDWEPVVKLTGRTTTSYVDRGGQRKAQALGLLQDGTEYLYKIISYNTANVRSSGTAPAKARTKVIPIQPDGITTTHDIAGKVCISWPPNPEVDVYAYVVEVSKKEDAGFRRLANVPKRGIEEPLSVEDDGLTPGTQRFYRIKALDREGIESLWSKVVQGNAKHAPDAPGGLKATRTDFQTTIQWDAPQQNDVKQYNVWSRRLVTWELLTTTDQLTYTLPAAEAARVSTVAVSAVDVDQIESAKSEPLKLEP